MPYIWKDAEGCQWAYEEMPSIMRHVMQTGHKDTRLIDEVNGSVVASFNPMTIKRWKEGTLVSEHGPQEYQSEPRDKRPPPSRSRGEPKPVKETAVLKAQVRPVVYDLDPVLYVLYEFTRSRLKEQGYEYNKSFAEFLREVVIRFFADHSEEFGVAHLFTPQERRLMAESMVSLASEGSSDGTEERDGYEPYPE